MSNDWVVTNDVNFVELRVTEPVRRFFDENAIFFGSPRLGLGGTVRVTKHGEIEQYVTYGGTHAFAMGAFSYSHSHESRLRVGRYCSIGEGLRVMGERHPMEWVTTSNITYCFRPDWNKPHFLRAHRDLMGSRWTPLNPPSPVPHSDDPVMGHDVWVGANVLLAKGIKVGTGAVLGASSVVTKDVPDYAIAVGNPARVVRLRFPEALCERLLLSCWWERHPDALFALDVRDPEAFLEHVSAVAAAPVRSFTWRDVLTGVEERA